MNKLLAEHSFICKRRRPKQGEILKPFVFKLPALHSNIFGYSSLQARVLFLGTGAIVDLSNRRSSVVAQALQVSGAAQVRFPQVSAQSRFDRLLSRRILNTAAIQQASLQAWVPWHRRRRFQACVCSKCGFLGTGDSTGSRRGSRARLQARVQQFRVKGVWVLADAGLRQMLISASA